MSSVLGVSRVESGFLVLELLADDGWSIAITPAGFGKIVITARRSDLADPVAVSGRSVADLALVLYEAARAAKRGER